jgi:hypothetical protein
MPSDDVVNVIRNGGFRRYPACRVRVSAAADDRRARRLARRGPRRAGGSRTRERTRGPGRRGRWGRGSSAATWGRLSSWAKPAICVSGSPGSGEDRNRIWRYASMAIGSVPVSTPSCIRRPQHPQPSPMRPTRARRRRAHPAPTRRPARRLTQRRLLLDPPRPTPSAPSAEGPLGAPVAGSCIGAAEHHHACCSARKYSAEKIWTARSIARAVPIASRRFPRSTACPRRR